MNDEQVEKISKAIESVSSALSWVGLAILLAAGIFLFGLSKMC